jgi:hypothetical protein
MENIYTVQTLKARKDIRGCVSFRVTDVETSTAWVREHIKDIQFFLGKIFARSIRVICFPVILPFFSISVKL